MKKFKVGILYAALGLTLIGFNGHVSAKNTSRQEISNIISAKKAEEIALKKTDGGSVIKCKLDEEDGSLVYEVKITNKNISYSLEIDAEDGSITEYSEKKLKTKKKKKSSKTKISSAKAKEIALKKTGGGSVVKCKLDTDDGVRVYEIEIVKGNAEYDLEINANTGKILDYDVDYDDDDDNDEDYDD